jgi:hypothetical protein
MLPNTERSTSNATNQMNAALVAPWAHKTIGNISNMQQIHHLCTWKLIPWAIAAIISSNYTIQLNISKFVDYNLTKQHLVANFIGGWRRRTHRNSWLFNLGVVAKKHGWVAESSMEGLLQSASCAGIRHICSNSPAGTMIRSRAWSNNGRWNKVVLMASRGV